MVYQDNVDTVLVDVCGRAAGRVARVQLVPDEEEIKKQVRQRLELRCRSRHGRPTPRIVWSRDGVVLVDHVDGIRITASR